MLHEFVILHRDEIIRRCRAKVAARSVPPPSVGCVFTIDLPRLALPALAVT